MLFVSAALVISATGCFGPSKEAEARLAQTKADGDQLLAKFDGLEDRFIGNQANVKFYTQLAERHQQVSQVACGNNEYHFNAMVEHMERQEEKARLLKRNHLAEGEGVGRELAKLASAARRSKKQSHD